MDGAEYFGNFAPRVSNPFAMMQISPRFVLYRLKYENMGPHNLEKAQHSAQSIGDFLNYLCDYIFIKLKIKKIENNVTIFIIKNKIF